MSTEERCPYCDQRRRMEIEHNAVIGPCPLHEPKQMTPAEEVLAEFDVAGNIELLLAEEIVRLRERAKTYNRQALVGYLGGAIGNLRFNLAQLDRGGNQLHPETIARHKGRQEAYEDIYRAVTGREYEEIT